jgi:hypothetical protein
VFHGPANHILRLRSTIAAVAVAMVFAASAAGASNRSVVGPYRLTMGWGTEPALAGFPNAVEVAVTDASGAPVTDAEASLVVNVEFNGAAVTLPLRPAGGRGRYTAAIVPTRPGVYVFRVEGTFRGRPVDAASTCSGAGFSCVTEPEGVEFPVRDPSVAELATRLARELPRVQAADDAALVARDLAIAAIALMALAVGGLLAFALRARRKSG